MSFLSGTVSFSRFQIVGGSPKRLDDALIDKLRAHAIGRQRLATPDHVEVGWIGGRHLLDLTFDVDKNIVLDCLHFGFRIDSAGLPPDLMRAYVEMELEALREGDAGANGRSLPRLKREARDAARKRAEHEIKEGRFRRQRHFPILWDTRHNRLYVGATQPAVLERLYPLFKETFGKRLEPLTAGAIGCNAADRRGALRSLESIAPASFVKHPNGNGHTDVYWTAHNADERDYLGNEFLLWLWYTLSEESDTVELSDKTDVAVMLVNRMILECPWAESGRETIQADSPTRLPESRRAVRSGKLPRKVGLIVSRQGEQYEFVLQAETFNVAAGKLPKSDANGNGNGRARFEERVEQIRHLSATIDLLFDAFLDRRLSSSWQAELNKITRWLRDG